MDDNQLDIIDRYLRGQLQGSDLADFEQKLAKDEALAAQVEQQRQADLAADAFFQDQMMKEMMAKGRLMLKEQKHQSASDEAASIAADNEPDNVLSLDPARRKRSPMTWMAIAASLLIIISIVGWQFGWLSFNTPDPVATVNKYYDLEGITNTGLLSASTDEATLKTAIESFEKEDYQNALIGFDELLDDPNFQQRPRVLFLSGVALTQMGETNQAIRRLEEVPTSARTFYMEAQWQKAFTLFKGGRVLAAKEVWTSIAEDSSHPRQSEARAILEALE